MRRSGQRAPGGPNSIFVRETHYSRGEQDSTRKSFIVAAKADERRGIPFKSRSDTAR